MILYIPFFIASLILVYLEKAKGDKEQKKCENIQFYIILLKESIVALFCSIIGYLINSKLLSNIYHFELWDDIKFTGFSLDRFVEVLNGYIYSLGYYSGDIFSVTLLQNFNCFITVGLLIISIIDTFRNSCAREEKAVTMFFISACAVFATVVCFTDFSYTDRYNIPIVVFSFPIIVTFLKRKIFDVPNIKSYVIGFFLLMLFCISGLKNYASYRTPSEFSKIAQILQKYDCDYGYGTFWNGNVLTELSDGEIEVHCWTVDIDAVSDINDSFQWLQLVEHDVEIPEGDIFCLLDSSQMGSSIAKKLEGAEVIYSSLNYTLYWFDSYESMISHITAYDFDFSAGTYLISGDDSEVNEESRVLHQGGISYGPYEILYPGNYQVICTGKNLDIAAFDVYSSRYELNGGKLTLFNVMQTDEQITYCFTINETLKQVETRITNNSQENVILDNLSIRKID